MGTGGPVPGEGPNRRGGLGIPAVDTETEECQVYYKLLYLRTVIMVNYISKLGELCFKLFEEY